MISKKIAIIGMGNMEQAIAHRLLVEKFVFKENLFLSNNSKDNAKIAAQADLIVLTIKPQVIKSVLSEIKEVVAENQLIISIAAGIQLGVISSSLRGAKRRSNLAIIRVMPNLSAKVGQSMSVWIANKNVAKNQKQTARKLLQALGKEIEVFDETILDKVTAISGSGPAYIFYMTKLLEKAGISLGLEKNFAKILARQTVVGSGKLLENSDASINNLIACVASKGGTTEQALQTFETGGFKQMFIKGIEAAYNRSLVSQ